VTAPPPRAVRCTVQAGGRRLWATATRAGADLVIAVGGGERPHVGCVVVAQSHPAVKDPGRIRVTSSVICIPPHREESLARPLAEALARAFGGIVTVTAGVHDDDLTPAGIATYLRLGDLLRERLLRRLGQATPAPASTPRR
jgi:gallate decarboxylase subunit D